MIVNVRVSDAQFTSVLCVVFCIVEADVLVNPITYRTSNLSSAGAVSSSLLTVGGTQLQTVSALVCTASMLLMYVATWKLTRQLQVYCGLMALSAQTGYIVP